MNSDAGDLVRRSSLFRNAAPAVFAQVMEAGIHRTIEAGSHFFLQNSPASHAYVLLLGRVKMLQITPGGQQIVMRIMTPGQSFGGIAMLNPQAGYPATAQAMQDSTAMAWSTSDLRRLAEKDPSIPLNTMQLMHGYITELQERQKALLTGRVEQRIARILHQLAAQSGRSVDEGMLIDLPLTRQDVAEMSGTTLYTVSRTLKQWERQGFLKLGRGKVIIRDPHALVRLADELIG